MRLKLTWTEPLESIGADGRVRLTAEAELDPEFFEKIADVIEARARKQTIYEYDPLDGKPAPVDTMIVRVTMGVIASAFRSISNREREHEAMADRVARERRETASTPSSSSPLQHVSDEHLLGLGIKQEEIAAARRIARRDLPRAQVADRRNDRPRRVSEPAAKPRTCEAPKNPAEIGGGGLATVEFDEDHAGENMMLMLDAEPTKDA
jgi:hypothetical protein